MAGDGRSGTFITFEGGEGSGKSTVAERAAAWLREQGHDVLLTREPEGTELGRHMWAFFKSPATAGKTMTAEAELFLFAAARAEHVRTVIAPALESGRIVLCDRFAASTTAHQGYGRGVELATGEARNVARGGGPPPAWTSGRERTAGEGRPGFEWTTALNWRHRGVNGIACPSLARQQFNVIKTVETLEDRLAHIRTPLTLSVIGCVVNGPGEARQTDIGLTGGGKGNHLVYLSGVADHKIEDDDLVDHLVKLVEQKAAESEAAEAAEATSDSERAS